MSESSNTGTFLKKDSKIVGYMVYPRFLTGLALSETAKLIYVLLLDRARLSISNGGWADIGFEGVLPQALHRGADDGGDASGTERAAAEAGADAKSGCEVIRIFDGKKNGAVLLRHKCTGASQGIEFGFLEETIGKRKWGTAFGN